MKKSLLALAVLGAFAGAASAQTNVTLYGIVDTAISSYDSDMASSDRTTRIVSGGQSASRIGFRGTEDLGGGLKANFILEQGFNSDNGTFADATQQFSRLANIGLSGGFGTVTLGKQLMPLKDAHDAIDPFGAAGITGNIENIFYNGSPAAFLPEAGRVSNTVKYTTPNFTGFTGRVSYTFGEVTGASSRNRNLGLGGSYVNGPLNVQFGFADIDAGGTAVLSSTTENQVLFVGATYDFKVVKLHVAFGDYETETAATGATTLEGRNALLGVTVPLGSSSSIIASYGKNDNRTAGATGENDSDRIALMYTYDLSKRTNFYVGYSKTSNDSGATLNAGSGAIATGAGGDPQQFNVGVRHRF